jgi:hypothetical protein
MLIDYRITGFFHALHDDEHLNFGVTLLDDIRTDITGIPALAPAWTEYEATVHHENLLFQVSKASPETREITVEDKVRDGAFRQTRRLLKYYANSPEAARKVAADELLFMLKDYNVADNRNLFGETAYIRNFLAECAKPVHAAQIAALPGLGELITDLTTANQIVDNLYTQRLHTVEELEALGKRVNVRKDADRNLISVLKGINTVYHYNEMTTKTPAVTTALERAAMRFNGLVNKLSLVIAQRGGKRHKIEEDDNNEETQTPDTTNPPAPATPPQAPDTTIPPINPEDLNPPSAGEHIASIKVTYQPNAEQTKKDNGGTKK